MQRYLNPILTLLALTLLIFVLVKALPGDAAQSMLGERANAEALKHVREQLGLDQPWWVQYGKFMNNLVHGDLGISIKSQRSVGEEVREKFPATLELTLVSLFLALVIGSLAGIAAAVWRNSWWDDVCMVGALAGVSMPIFWLALLALWFFSVHLGILPVSGRLDPMIELNPITGIYTLDSLLQANFEAFWNSLTHLILPALVLSTVPTSVIARFMRSSLLEVLNQDYVRTARAKGLDPKSVIFRHALRNAMIPVLTVGGLQFGTLLGGAIITETIFAWPGVGRWLLDSIQARDTPALQGAVLVLGVLVILVNMLTDFSYRLVDPRLRKGIQK